MFSDKKLEKCISNRECVELIGAQNEMYFYNLMCFLREFDQDCTQQLFVELYLMEFEYIKN